MANSKIIRNFVAIQPALGMGGSRHIGFRALKVHPPRKLRACTEPHRGAGKGRFLNVIFYHIELRNFDSIRRYRNEASTSGVYITQPMASSLPSVILNEVKNLESTIGDGRIINRTAWAG